MTGIFLLLLASLAYMSVSRFRLAHPYFIIGVTAFNFMVTKVVWLKIFGGEYILGVTEDQIGSAVTWLSIFLLVSLGLAEAIWAVTGGDKSTRSSIPDHIGKIGGGSSTIGSIAALRRSGVASGSGVARQGLLPLQTVLMIAVPVVIWVIAWSGPGVIFYENPLGIRRLLEGQGMAYLMIVANTTLSYCVLRGTQAWVSNYLSGRSKVRFVVGSTFVAVYAAYSGFASTPFIFCGVIIMFLEMRWRARWGWIALLCFPLLVGFAFIHNFYRQARAAGESVAISTVYQEYAADKEVFSRVFDRLDYLEIFTLGFHRLTENGPEGTGKILEVLLQPIPRVLWPDKPRNLSTEMSWMVIPNVASIGSSANFNAHNEFIRAWGVLGGTIIGALLLAVILSWARHYYERALIARAERTYLVLVFPYVWLGYIAGYINDFALPCLFVGFAIVWALDLIGELKASGA